jgi:hypothetical protein
MLLNIIIAYYDIRYAFAYNYGGRMEAIYFIGVVVLVNVY